MAKQKKPLPAMEWLQPRVRFTRWVSLIGYLALLLLIGVWNGVFADLHGARTWVVLSIVLVPLPTRAARSPPLPSESVRAKSHTTSAGVIPAGQGSEYRPAVPNAGSGVPSGSSRTNAAWREKSCRLLLALLDPATMTGLDKSKYQKK